MKKYYNIYFSAIIIIGLFIGSCEKDKDNNGGTTDNCSNLTEAYISAYQAYVADMTSQEKCENFVKAAEDLINNCDYLTPEQKQEYLDQYNSAECAELSN